MNIHQSFLYQGYFMNWILSPAKFICWGPLLQCDLFGERVFREASKIKWCRGGGSLIQQDWCPYKKSKKQKRQNSLSRSLSVYAHRGRSVKTWLGGSESGRTLTPTPNPAAPWSWTFSFQNWWENNCSVLFCLSHPICTILLWQL